MIVQISFNPKDTTQVLQIQQIHVLQALNGIGFRDNIIWYYLERCDLSQLNMYFKIFNCKYCS